MKKDPDAYRAKMEAMEAARMRMQEKYNQVDIKKTRPRTPWHVGPLKVGLLSVNTPQNPPDPQAYQTHRPTTRPRAHQFHGPTRPTGPPHKRAHPPGPTTRPTAPQIHGSTRPTGPPDNGPIRPTGPTTHRPMVKNSEKL